MIKIGKNAFLLLYHISKLFAIKTQQNICSFGTNIMLYDIKYDKRDSGHNPTTAVAVPLPFNKGGKVECWQPRTTNGRPYTGQGTNSFRHFVPPPSRGRQRTQETRNNTGVVPCDEVPPHRQRCASPPPFIHGAHKIFECAFGEARELKKQPRMRGAACLSCVRRGGTK